MEWTIRTTDTFIESLSQIKSNKRIIHELDKKLQRLKEDPLNTGGWLSGALHGKKATRIAQRYRLIFKPDEKERAVYLILIDHRQHIYDY
ncbi:hypothetical protein RJ53_09275 [Methanocalculus chunghsingensis]|uniref:Plasmid stabilization system n=1 Tax=Methanocalculus chunghsingensis TaxID=156457 RepID=A0A8J8B4S0_9EURY|nr:type II toxin-antitoxin system RelE/ParE family toxin [Methanocalculus chunghsingensis]MBR1369655.1 hypothetical protein [Methanocalculus chunghsingensis]